MLVAASRFLFLDLTCFTKEHVLLHTYTYVLQTLSALFLRDCQFGKAIVAD